ncbi:MULTISPECIES: ABC transporter permease [unclassified Rhizobium]|uniref:ABC transporter permease n=1 Tax=unclassified Rhizobium TaxID=2613769 RepID=UPI001ADA15E5|nr:MULTISPECIES: ABC transporter permease [unclassified Rhizobium]MBO9096683.1 ABC transporter permease [Rhizobium sp. L58/93]MBO9134444.1 ABC transporter permease [Rhizobium sp. B209b/85]MBO9166938.1 ABC transporter permease [Rhizobium sp. L245/93]MBO9182910.1 ABC transporter permease [Rhizobium sp. E27B/91]QXZ83285.1 ABC transporter permease [Rhizobium sp. K1/93]
MSWSDLVFWQIVLGGTLRLATPIFLAALGEMITERSGTINLGIDGIMTAGAFSAVVCASIAGWQGGLLGAVITGTLYGSVIALSVVKGGANQIITGIAISLIGSGLTSFLFQLWQPSGQSMMFVPLAPNITIPFLSDLPFIGPILFKQNLITYAALVLLMAAIWLMNFTRVGLVLRAVGDGAAASAVRGIDTDRVRMVAIIVGAALMGLGGAAITIGFLGSFNDGLTNGRGYVALAVVIIGRWSPVGAVLGAFLFAFFDSLGLRAQSGMGFLPNEVFSILPYAMTLLVLIFTARSKIAPRELGR